VRNRIVRIASVVILSVAVLYALKSWKRYDDRTCFDVESVAFDQTKVDIEVVQSAFPVPIWHVKSESEVTCFSIRFKNEGERSFSDSTGLLSVLMATLFEGAGEYDAVALKKQLADHSVSINISSEDDDIHVTVSCLEKYLDKAVEILCAILSKAHLKQEKIEIAKQGCITSINQSMFFPSSLVHERCTQLMYRKGHPYQVNYANALKKIPTYTRDDVVKCYSSVFIPADAEITVVSSMSDDQIIGIFDRIHTAIKNRKNDFKDAGEQETELNSPGATEHVELDNPQTAIIFALPGVQRKSPKIYAAIAATEIFGRPGTILSRLAECVREKGFVYRIKASLFSSGGLHSVTVGRCDTRPENVQEVVTLIRSECEKMKSNGVTREELNRFKHWKFASCILNSSAEMLEFVGSVRTYGIGVEEVNTFLHSFANLTVEEVNAAAKEIFQPEKMIVVDCGQSIADKNGGSK
jgi:zinc protease